MNRLPDYTGNSLRETYSRSALQILSTCQNWRDQPNDIPEPLRESELLKRESCEIWRLALELSRDDFLGLHAGTSLPEHVNGHFLTTLAANSKTVGEALENLCNYHAVCSDAPHPELERRNRTVAVTISDSDSEAVEQVTRHMGECLFSAIVTVLGVACKQPIFPSKVTFSWSSPGSTGFYESIFKAPVYFDSDNTYLEFSLATLDTPIPYADESLLATLTRYADSQLNFIQESGSWVAKVKSLLCHSGFSIDMDIETAAANLCISHRTLQKRLKAEGTNYQKIVRDIKITMAREYLSNTSIPLAEIAILLGYTEQSAFNHAFKLWTGLTPRRFRESSC